jgi:hypothetical protein
MGKKQVKYFVNQVAWPTINLPTPNAQGFLVGVGTAGQ